MTLQDFDFLLSVSSWGWKMTVEHPVYWNDWSRAGITLVTSGSWCVSYVTGGDVPEGLVRLSVFDSTSWAGILRGHTVRGERDGELMTKKEADAHCLEKGYLKVYQL